MCGQHLSTCEKSPHKLLSDSTHSLHVAYESVVLILSDDPLFFIPSKVDICENSIVYYLACILTNWDRVPAEFLNNQF